MSSALLTWVGVPLLGGIIGYVTNRIAVKMIFRPVRPVSVLGLRFQGLIGRRQPEIARNVGRIVGEHLVSHQDLLQAFERIDLEAALGGVIDDVLARKIGELQRMPFVGSFFTPDRIADLRGSIVRGLMRHREEIVSRIEKALEEGLDIHAVVEEKVAAFPVETLERLILDVASKELRMIEILGGVLGFLIGLVQAALFAFAAQAG